SWTKKKSAPVQDVTFDRIDISTVSIRVKDVVNGRVVSDLTIKFDPATTNATVTSQVLQIGPTGATGLSLTFDPATLTPGPLGSSFCGTGHLIGSLGGPSFNFPIKIVGTIVQKNGNYVLHAVVTGTVTANDGNSVQCFFIKACLSGTT